ncbi:hypothetical protein LDENG_00127260 [Lucifuga dentata]|nr:hypothetical protein LDENG_00127260 [Lucifuga dentata]
MRSEVLLAADATASMEYSLYFPAAPLSRLSQPADYRSLPRRSHVYLGETVQFLLVLRCRTGALQEDNPGSLPWRDVVGSLSAVAGVCVAESRQDGPAPDQEDLQSSDSEEAEEFTGEGDRAGTPDTCRTFRSCKPLLTHYSPDAERQQRGGDPEQTPLVLDDEVVFSLSVSLDKLPINTLKAKVRRTDGTSVQRVFRAKAEHHESLVWL